MNKFAKFQIFVMLLLFSVSAFYGGYYFGKRGYLFELKKNPPEVRVINRSPSNEKVDFSLFWNVWDLLDRNYLERPLDGKKMLYGAIKGMVNSLDDPYTSFLEPPVNVMVNNSLNGTYEGIGAELGMKDNQIIVVAPLEGSPAKEAGVKAGDKILEIAGESTIGKTLTDAVSRIRGGAGTFITLTLQRGGDKSFNVTIKRGQIVTKSVTWENKGDGIAYMRINTFGEETNNDWSKAASEVNVKMSDLDAVILDLRGNPGGYLQSAVYVAGEFYSGKPVLFEESAIGKQTPLNADRTGSFVNLPVVILVDGGSASASEILTAALKANANATIVGTKSFGKGTIQTTKDFEDGSGIHITVAKWLTPEKVWVHKQGITPDVIVERTEEEIKKGVDSQLNKAIEVAKKL